MICSALQVEENVGVARRALGLDPNPHAALEAAVLEQALQLLAPVQGVTWPSGHPLPSEEAAGS
jgi:ribosomal protein S12 methylthiotransferase accessory factor YcaO